MPPTRIGRGRDETGAAVLAVGQRGLAFNDAVYEVLAQDVKGLGELEVRNDDVAEPE